MSDWLNRKDVCQRCFSGIDDGGDGNCLSCVKMDDTQAAWMKRMRLSLEIAGAQERLNGSYPQMTDDASWVERAKSQLRTRSRAYCFAVALFSMPFCIVHWAALRGQAAMEVLCEEKE